MYDTGTTAFMVLSTALVVMMTPALALFYGGLFMEAFPEKNM